VLKRVKSGRPVGTGRNDRRAVREYRQDKRRSVAKRASEYFFRRSGAAAAERTAPRTQRANGSGGLVSTRLLFVRKRKENF